MSSYSKNKTLISGFSICGEIGEVTLTINDVGPLIAEATRHEIDMVKITKPGSNIGFNYSNENITITIQNGNIFHLARDTIKIMSATVNDSLKTGVPKYKYASFEDIEAVLKSLKDYSKSRAESNGIDRLVELARPKER